MENLRFIDNHIHGSFGINFNYSNYNETKYVLKELYKRNIKGIFPTLVGETIENIQRQLALFIKIKNEQLKNFEDETLILGVHLEGSFLNKKKAGIQDETTFLDATVDNFKKLTGDYMDIVKIVTIAPEIDCGLIDFLIENDIKAQAGHSLGTDLKNTKTTTHHFNAMPSIHHRNPSITLSALINDDIYCEIIADTIHVSKEMLKLFFKSKPIDKVLLVSDALPISNYNKDIIFCNKKINPLGKDETGTLAGSIKTLDTISYNLIKENILSSDDINKMAFFNQINYINLKNIEVDILMK